MESEKRLYTDDQVKQVFKETKRTHDLVVHDIEYFHEELFPDFYLVRTDKGNYVFQVSRKYSRTGKINYNLYHRIVKTKKIK